MKTINAIKIIKTCVLAIGIALLGLSTGSCNRHVSTYVIVKPNGKTKTVRGSRAKCQKKRKKINRKKARQRHDRRSGYGIN